MAHRRLAVTCSHLRDAEELPGSSSELRRGADCPPGGCVFCSIIRGESPSFKLYEDNICLCILDSNPLSYGHSLVIPKSHFPCLQMTPPSVVAAMCSTVPFLSDAIMKASHCDSFNLLVNNGSAAGQVIFHTHFHIIPRKAGDQLWPSESFVRRPIERSQETFSLVKCVKEQLALNGGSLRVDDPMLQNNAEN